ncbi:MAG: hypothetical protein AB1679_02735 [Actinomycetota bacterium]
MELFGRRWGRWDGLVAAAAVTLIVVSYQPWWTLHAEGSSVTIWNAWRVWRWSNAVTLGALAAGVHLAYQGRPQAGGAAWLGVAMLLAGLGLTGWEWHRATNAEVTIVTYATYARLPEESSDDYRRRKKEAFSAAAANARPLPTRSAPRSGFYAGTGSLIVLFAAIVRGLVRPQPRRAPAG